MNQTHIHLLANHVPVIGTIGIAALLAVAAARRSEELARVAFAFTVPVALIGVVTYLTGEPAESAIERLADVSEAAKETHEALAEAAFIALSALGAVSLAVLLAFRRRAIRRGVVLSGLLAVMTIAAMMATTAYFGGQIRHSEIRPPVPGASDREGDDERR